MNEEFTRKAWPGAKFKINSESSYTNQQGVKQVVVDVWDRKKEKWINFSRQPQAELDEVRKKDLK